VARRYRSWWPYGLARGGPAWLDIAYVAAVLVTKLSVGCGAPCREEQITRLLKTLERMREQEALLVGDLTAMTAKKDQYKGELRELRAMVKESFERGRAAKAEADQRTAFTIIK
jgi:hypothetical protein